MMMIIEYDHHIDHDVLIMMMRSIIVVAADGCSDRSMMK
jgi:hypothetical protein